MESKPIPGRPTSVVANVAHVNVEDKTWISGNFSLTWVVWDYILRSSSISSSFLKKILFIYLFLERGREGEREGEKHRCVIASHMPPTGLQPRLGIESTTLWFASQHSIH